MEALTPKFKNGDHVIERGLPDRRLIVRHHDGNMYYCLSPDYPQRKELVFLERDLVAPKLKSN